MRKRKYTYIYFIPMLYNNDIKYNSKKSFVLANKNIIKIVKWYNKNKIFDDVSYYSKDNYIVAKINNLLYDKNNNINNYINIDNDGNYLINKDLYVGAIIKK